MAPFKIGEVSKTWSDKSQIPVWYQGEATSTNSVAKEIVISESPVTLYLTDHQTNGRGRGGNSWSNVPEGKALLSSWVFVTRKAPQPVLSPAIGLAVWTAFKASFPWLKFSLKAPNDLFLEDRKLAGILIENIPQTTKQGNYNRLIVGLGVNVFEAPTSSVDTSIALADRLPNELNQETWFNVLDRLLLEISLAVSQTKETLTPAQTQALLHALNRHPFQEVPYRQVDPDGCLWKGEQKTNWSEL
ncbi:MAG: biotin synthetase [Pseudobdellovibrionaceae bacterium]